MKSRLIQSVRRLMGMCVALAGFGLSVQAQTNTLAVASGTIAQGGEASLSISLENESPISGGQFTVTLPQGISVKEVVMNGERSNGHTVEYRWNETKHSLLILLYAQPTATLKGSDGVLCTLSLSAAEEATAGDFPVTLGDVRLATDAITQAECVTTEGVLTVMARYEIVADATEGGAVTGGGVFDAGASVTLAATPDEGYHFVRWSDGSTANPYTFKATADVNLTAEFAPNVYRIIYMVDGVEYQTEEVLYGCTVTAIAAPTKEGHTFSGWSGMPVTMPAKDVTVSGSFAVNSYTVTYIVDGKVHKTESIAYGSAVTAIAAPTKEGYTFSGWSGVPATMPAKDVTVSGSFTVNNYTITYMVDGKVHQTASIAYGSAVTAIAAPTKEGHTFSGWSGVPATMPAKDVTVSGSFTVNSYTVTYIVDGKVHQTESIAYGSAVTAIAAPTKEGHTFSGWSEVPATMPAKDVTVSGSFTVNSYTVKFMLEGAVFAEYTLQYGSTIEVPEAPQKEGFTFSGWGKVPATMPAQDMVFEGSYMNNPYTIIYMVDGVEYHRALMEYGSVITLIAVPVKEGYTFSGWSGVPATMPAKDVTVSGSFTVNNYTITYMVDGKVHQTASIAYGSAVTAIAAPTKEGHTFSGWSGVPATMPAKDVTVSGNFTVNSYTVTYIVDGKVHKTENYAYGTEITLLEEPVKEGYTFSGWSEVPVTMPAGNITVNGSFTVNSYTITYMVDGEVYQTESIAYGSAVTAIAAPTKEGHTFSGWSGVPATMPAKDVTVSGSFAVNNYTITYMVDGEVYQTASIAYGSAVTAIAAPTKEGHTFSGWSGVPATMPAKDVTVNGSFTVNSYTVTYMVDGKVHQTASIAYGSAVTAIAVPTKEGHTFSGWSEVPATMPAKDVTVSGSFTVNNYTITYMVDGKVHQTENIAYGSAVTAIAAPTKEGYTFSGWNGVPATMPAKDVTVSGSFAVNSYTVKFMLEGAVFAEYTLQYGITIEVPEAPQKEGFTFSGWGKVPDTMPAQDMVFEGSYMNNPYTIIYVVDGVEYHRALVEYGSVITLIAVPVKEGYTFSGWSEVPATMPAGDITVSGSFTVNSYIVTYMVDGEVYQTASIAYGAEITLLEKPVKEGYTFSGWSSVPATMPAKDVTVSGAFAINKYLVTFKIGDEVIATDTLEYGAVIVVPEAPEKEGYTFDGWGEVAETVPANDLTYEGTYTVNTYKVYYYVGEELVHTAEVAYGEAIPEYIYEPTGEGDVFEGWVGETYETMPAHDLTYVANITNGIDAMSTDNGQQSTVIYDLMGRKVTDTENLKGGIYIVNGRKVVTE